MEFKNILVPIDFTVNTDIAVKKAMEMVHTEDALIHLLHVVDPWSDLKTLTRFVYQSGTRSQNARFTAERNALQLIKRQMALTMPVSVKVETWLATGEIEKWIIRKAQSLKCQLVVIGKHHHSRAFPGRTDVAPNKIAKLTNSAVLIVKSGALGQKIKSIVVPVGEQVPRRKIDVLIALSEKFHAKVHLVTLKRSQGLISNESSQALLQTYRILKGLKFVLPLEHKVVEGKNLANAALKYAQLILADMLLVSPESETMISKLTGQQITDLLITNSRLQVLEVEP